MTCHLLLSSDQFDSHDDRDDEGEGESVEEHKSVIMHLLSQVRLGMDLTKVKSSSRDVFLCSVRLSPTAVQSILLLLTNIICASCFFWSTHAATVSLLHYISQVVLPTFILERRSLLEMYADFFAHPDLFVRYVTISATPLLCCKLLFQPPDFQIN